MLALPMSAAYATKPITRTLSGTMYVIGPGTGTDILAGESGNTHEKFRDLPFVLIGDITSLGGLYHGNLLTKPSGDITWHGTWTMEVATIEEFGSGSLKFGSSWDEGEPAAEWWITGATGDLSSLRGRGTATPLSAYSFEYVFEVQINP